MPSAEHVQQRDFDKYYQSWLRATDPTSDDAGVTSTSCRRDPTLLALAQLTALRLKVETGTISLIHGNGHILLAEAGQSSPLSPILPEPEGDNASEDSSAQPRDPSLDAFILGSTWLPKDGGTEDSPYAAFVAHDVANDARLVESASLFSKSRVGFFAGVPILTSHGHEIGVFAVSDPEPRSQPLTTADIKLLQDVAQIASHHLELVRSTTDRGQSEGFVRGLTSFVEELSTLKNDLNNPDHTALDDQRSENSNHEDVRATDPGNVDARGRATTRSSSTNASQPTDSPARSNSSRPQNPEVLEPKHTRDSYDSSNQDLDKAVDNVRQVFSRAARAITDATSAQGCVFFDTCPSIISGSSGAQPSGARSVDGTTGLSGSESSSDEELAQSANGEDIPAINKHPKTLRRLPSMSRKERGRVPATILGISLAPSELNTVQAPLTQRDLRRCLRQYPHGKCFLLEHGRIIASGQSTSDAISNAHDADGSASTLLTKHKSDRLSRGDLPDNLLKQLVNAKWLMFLPLFNPAQQQWHACGFVWSNEAQVHNLDTQILYLKAFGSCIMSEVLGMEAVNTSIARTTFIASISHDLRSPLHGVLGNLEFLEDTLTSAYQVSLVGSIETCGKTLLDTIDHLLDYAKINNLNRVADKHDSKHASLDARDSKSSLLATVDLALLLEEVAEAAFTGQTFRKKNLRGRDAVDNATDAIQSLAIDDSKSVERAVHEGSEKFSGRVFFILDIQYADSWMVSCESTGAIRRVILNVVGNAIKYCDSGCIEVKLCEPQTKDNLTEVTISVKDTGIGMSKSFLENHLFQAFSQEDAFAAGPGLGLSIARQLVDQMKGNVSVRSEKGVGTHVDISLPMYLEPSETADSQDILQKAIRVTTGKKICLLNPNYEKPSGTVAQMPRLSTSIAHMSEDWFKLEFTESTTIEQENDSDIFVYAEPPPIEYLLKHHSERRAAGKNNKEVALLIVCTNAFEAAALRSAGVAHLTSLGRVIEVISQPVGIRKLAKVLLSSLQQVEASSDTEMNDLSKQALVSFEAQQGSADTEWSSSPVVYDPISKRLRPSIEPLKWKSEQPQVRSNPQNLDIADLEFGQIRAGALPGLVPLLPRPTNDGSGETRMPSVLAVDDNPINLRLLVTFMKKIKLPYAEAVNGLEAYNKFKEAETPFDYVLMDLQMPVMDGLESTRKIRDYEKQMNSQNPTTIIAITGVGNESVKKECMESGMTQFLTKPVKFKTLQQLLERHNKD